jgi:hypothetical protein
MENEPAAGQKGEDNVKARWPDEIVGRQNGGGGDKKMHKTMTAPWHSPLLRESPNCLEWLF